MTTSEGLPARELSTPDLEQLLRVGVRDPRRRAEVEAELLRRASGEYRWDAPPAPPAAAPPQPAQPGAASRGAHSPPAAAPQPASAAPLGTGWGGPQPIVIPPPAPAPRTSPAVGCVTAAVVAVVLAGLVALLQGLGQEGDSPGASFCYTSAVTCPLPPGPVGVSCYCSTDFGPVYGTSG